MEKGLSSNFDNFGLTHEISFAYSITPNLTEDRVMLEEGYEESLVYAEEGTEGETLSEKDAEIAELKRRLAENDAILAELMFRQDSLEQNQQRNLEKRFEMVMRMVRQETGGDRPDLEDKARETYFINNDQALAQRDNDNIPSGISEGEAQNEVAQIPLRDVSPKTKAPTPKTINRPVKSREFRDLQDVEDGYYIVANVYKGSVYLNKFIKRMEDQGFVVDYIDNPNNGLKYVYLKRTENWTDAEQAVRTKLGGAYEGDLWVMKIANRYTNDAYAANSEKIREQAEKYDGDALLQKNVVAQDKLAADKSVPQQFTGQGIGSDYYIIANVFANPKNATRFVRHLNSLGLNASFFVNPENNYRYVYLKRYESWNSALISYYSNLNDTYDEKMWIMRVTPNLIA
jgi:hypothetical protein